MQSIHGCVSCQQRYCAKKVGLFESFDDQDMERLLPLIERMTLPKGSYLFQEGDPADRLYILNGGSAKVFRNTKDGKEQILYLLSEGDYYGELSLLRTETHELSALALEDTYLCTLGKKDFDALVTAYPSLYAKMLEHAYSRIQALERSLATIQAKDVDSKLATLLLQLADQFGIQKLGAIEVPLKLTREEMANAIGLTRETVSRKLSQFQSDGLIVLVDQRTLQLIDTEGLMTLKG